MFLTRGREMNIIEKDISSFNLFDMPTNLASKNIIPRNLAINGYNNIEYSCFRTKIFTRINGILLLLLERYYVTIFYENTIQTFSAIEYPNNCSAIFIINSTISEDLFDTLIAISGYTFAFSNYNLFYNSNHIKSGLFFRQINARYRTKKEIRDLYFDGTVNEDNFIINDTNQIIRDRYGSILYLQHSPFYGSDFRFLYSLSDKANFNDYYKSFFIDDIDINKNFPLDKYKIFHTANANRTGNNLGIFISNDF